MSDGQAGDGRDRPQRKWTGKRDGRSGSNGGAAGRGNARGQSGSGRSSGGQSGTGQSGRNQSGRNQSGRPQSGGAQSGRGHPGGGSRGGQVRTPAKSVPSGPTVPEDITGRELDSDVRAELVGLSRPAADRVARHLVAAGRLLEEDPNLAVEHAWAARKEGARLAVVREACGYAAYAAGQYERALAELRAARRMSGSPDYVAVMADCERGLGRPERALEVGASADRSALSREVWLELQIVLAGARRDMGQTEAALGMLDQPELRGSGTDRWTARLRYAYADLLEGLGRTEDAREWFVRAELADLDDETDASHRRAVLDGEEEPYSPVEPAESSESDGSTESAPPSGP